MKKIGVKKAFLFGFLIIVLILITTQVKGYLTWRNMNTLERLQVTMNRVVDDKKVFGSVVKIESKDGDLKYEFQKGNLLTDDIFCIGSITKMFTASIIFQLVDEDIILLTDTIDKFLTEEELYGLHFYDGKNHGETITIEQLVSQTTGLPDHYLEEVDGKSLFEEIIEKDRAYDFEDFLERTKLLNPHFINGEEGKAYYADINFDILGIIIERVTGMRLEDVYSEKIFSPLNLEKTSLATPNSNYAKIHLNEEIFEVSLAKSSMRANGGIISNVDELMVFLRAFMEGELFSVSHIKRGEWNEIQFDYHEYKNGMMRFKLDGIWALLGSYELLGHSGSTGDFAFYSPEKEIYVAGITNQATDSSIEYRFLYQLLGSI